MKKVRRIGISFFLCSALLFACFWRADASVTDNNHRVFILHSYDPADVCGGPQHDGVTAALMDAGYLEGDNMILGVYYMDTKRKNNTPELIEKEAGLALDAIKSFAPHVLVTLDDDAFRTVGLSLAGAGLPIVFSGMNGQPENYHRMVPFMESRSEPGGNITGVYEKLHISTALRVHSKLFPGLKKVVVLVDHSATGRAIRRQVELELGKEPVPCDWEIMDAASWEQYRALVASANEDPDIGAIYPAALVLKDAAGSTYTVRDIFEWTVLHSRKPEIALNYEFTRMGLFGGAAVDFFSMGRQAGRMTVRILAGEPPGKIAVEEAKRHALVFNLIRAAQLDIHIPMDILMAADEIVH